MSIPGTSVEVKKFYFENKKQQQQQIIIEGYFCQFLSDDYCTELEVKKGKQIIVRWLKAQIYTEWTKAPNFAWL